jgi:ribose transport system ATP-binding protein
MTGKSQPDAMATVLPTSVELSGVSKWFGGTPALRNVSFRASSSEVHALAGENGAGKSTLIRILSGVITDYQGELRIAGRPARLGSPVPARAAGIATIHQELSLVGSMSVADNLALGRSSRPFARFRPGPQRERARRLLGLVGLDLDPERLLEELSLGERQLVEIARALGDEARLLIMDEPTSALCERESSLLLERMKRLRAQGTAIVLITHRLEEVYAIADRITVLRDGAVAAVGCPETLSRQELVLAMAGRRPSSAPTVHGAPHPEPLLVAQGLRIREPSRRRGLCSPGHPGRDLSLPHRGERGHRHGAEPARRKEVREADRPRNPRLHSGERGPRRRGDTLMGS